MTFIKFDLMLSHLNFRLLIYFSFNENVMRMLIGSLDLEHAMFTI